LYRAGQGREKKSPYRLCSHDHFNYPTLAGCYQVAAFNAANKLALERSVEERAARSGIAVK
jgi:hypothetical protein